MGPRGQRWLIDREIFEGAPDQSDEPWIQFSDALGRTYPTPAGGTKAIDLSGIDSGFATDRVYRFAAGRPNLYALDGQHQPGKPWLGTPVKRDIKDRNKRVIAKVLAYPVGNYDVKTEVMAALANLVQGPDAAGAWPRNVIHLTPTLCDATMAQELTAERLVDPDEVLSQASGRRRRLLNPKAQREWKRIAGRPNDWFDATVYALALGWHLEHKRQLTAERWAELLLSVHGTPVAPDLFAAAEDPFQRARQTPAEVAATPPPRDDGGWLGDRTSGWGRR